MSIGFKFFGKCPAILSDLFFYVKVPSNYTFLEPQEHSYTEHLDLKIQCFAHSTSCLFCYAIFLYGNWNAKQQQILFELKYAGIIVLNTFCIRVKMLKFS